MRGRCWLLAIVLGVVGWLGVPAAVADAAVITVTTDSGAAPVVDAQCSLSEAIANARNDNQLVGLTDCPAGDPAPTVDEIRFNIPGFGVKTIIPGALTFPYNLTDSTIVDGSTQPAGSVGPHIIIDGTVAGAGGVAFQIQGNNNTLRGLSIGNWDSTGVQILAGADNNVLEANYIGLDPGDIARPNGTGVTVVNGNNNRIGGPTITTQMNVISGNSGVGIQVDGGTNTTTIIGNRIGTDQLGLNPLPNGDQGIRVTNGAANVRIGGTGAGEGNVISGNADEGILVDGGATGTTIQGNLIGLNSTGTAAIPNSDEGVRVTVAANTTVGGTTAAARNVISGNGSNGIVVGVGGTGTVIQGNYIGTNRAGTAAVPNGNGGIGAGGASGVQIGGTAAGAGNVISGNVTHGISLSSASGFTIQGNLIGTAANGTSPLPNTSNGIDFFFETNHLIGGTTDEAANTIAFNTGAGLSFASFNSSGNRILRNRIFSNGGLGIQFLGGGNPADVNDAGDADTGPNGRQNYPVISAAASNGSLGLSGTFNSTPNTNNFRLEFFSSPTCDASGNGEGQTYLGAVTVNTDGNGDAAWNLAGLPQVPVGSVITATATSPANNTSEFSACRTVVAANTGAIIVQPAQLQTTEAGGQAAFSVVLSQAPFDTVTIPVSSSDTTEGTVNVTQLVFTPANFNVPQIVTVTGVDDPIVDGDIAYAIVLGAAQSNDSSFNGVDPTDVAAINLDNEQPAAPTPTPTPGPVDPTDPANNDGNTAGKPKNEKADDVKETETERQQRERTNRAGSDDYRTEGNVVSVDLEASPRTATIATRDGQQVIVLLCRDSCDDPRVGDYLEAEGVKEHEALFYADSVTSRGPGR